MKISITKGFLIFPIILSFHLSAEENTEQVKTQPNPVEARRSEQAKAPKNDPFAAVNSAELNTPGKWRANQKIRTVQIRAEWYEVDTALAIKALDEWKPDRDAAELRNKAISQADTILHRILVTQLDVGEKTTNNSILEKIYPTEFSDGIGCTLFADKSAELKKESSFEQYLSLLKKTAVMPEAFETRNIGTSVEMALEPVNSDANQFDLGFDIEETAFHGKDTFGKGLLETTMPIFSSKRSQSTLRFTSGQWKFVNIIAATEAESGKPSKTRSAILFLRIDVLN